MGPDFCVYCETGTQTDYSRVGDRFLQLCEECRHRFNIPVASDDEVMYAPVDLPPGVFELEHTCPALLLDRLPREACRLRIVLVEVHPGYRSAECPSCGVGVRSKLV